jgi:hypothetical protein
MLRAWPDAARPKKIASRNNARNTGLRMPRERKFINIVDTFLPYMS